MSCCMCVPVRVYACMHICAYVLEMNADDAQMSLLTSLMDYARITHTDVCK